MEKTFDLENFLNEDNLEYVKESDYHKYAVAPMLDVTNRYFRVLIRMLTKKATLYTEMIHSDTILNSNILESILDYDLIERPIIFQLGGSDPKKLAAASKIVEKWGYDEINLNCGCPSPKVTKNCFGASLMKDPERVGECMKAIKNAVKIKVSVKCRLGVDNLDDYDFLKKFIEIVYKISGVTNYIIHARKAFLKGLNPKQNRSVPPLIYERVFKIAEEFPDFKISINGGIKDIETMKDLLKKKNLFGVMIGRACYENLMHMSNIDSEIFGGTDQNLTRRTILINFAKYMDRMNIQNKFLNFNIIIKPVLSIFAKKTGNKKFRNFAMDKKNFTKTGSFEKHISYCIEEMEKINLNDLDSFL